ncbi:MAG: class A beta-lactamase-related serine hydrolase [Gammaproteobacteria bacterium]|nr:MAG: class A beta-lactamase-related serine hydrolase [Gammaproteobacteria bacterium]
MFNQNSFIMKSRVFFLMLCAGLFFTSSCKKTATDDLCVPSLNLEVFDSQLRGNLTTGLKGYTYLIMKDGQVKYTYSNGEARSHEDGYQPWDEFQTMHVASISKTISTVATLRLLKMKGLSVDEGIGKYLPPHWDLGLNVKYITFSELMSQRTGFYNVLNESEDLSTKYEGLRKMVAAGANGLNTRKYSNVHHALLRVILPVLWDYPNISGRIYDDDYTAMRYEQIVNTLVFQPLGIQAELKDDDPNGGVLAYSSGTDPKGTFEEFDYTKSAGGYGWVLSAYDLAKFWAYLWHCNELIDESQRQAMRTTEMGLWNSGNTTGGRYYCKLGGWFRTVNGFEHWLRSAAVEFPDGTAVVLFVNSTSSRGLRDIIVDAYEKSFGCF